MILLIYRITFFKWYTISNFSIFGGFKIFSPETLNAERLRYIEYIQTLPITVT